MYYSVNIGSLLRDLHADVMGTPLVCTGVSSTCKNMPIIGQHDYIYTSSGRVLCLVILICCCLSINDYKIEASKHTFRKC